MSDIAQDVKGISRWSTAIGILTLILGFLAISAPLVSGVAVAITVGLILSASGIMEMVFAFQAGSFGRGLLAFLFGGVSLVMGGVMMARPLLGLASLTFVLAAYFMIDGVTHIMCGVKHKPEQGWVWIVFSGAVSLLLALMIWGEWPLSGRWAIGTLIGIRLIFTGWSMISMGAVGRAAAREMAPEA